MLKGFEHVNLTCSDMDRTIAFYRDLLGLREVLVKPASDGGKLAFLDAGGGMLEIYQPPGPVVTPARQVPRTEAGIRHIAITVEDVEAAHAHLAAAGVDFTELPRKAINTEIVQKVAFCRDPDGISVELVER